MDVTMKARTLVLLSLGCVVALGAWLVNVPSLAEANAVPEKYQETLNKGLEYLVRNQCQDGHWEGDGGKHPVAMTGLVGLALVMEAVREHRGRSSGTTWGRRPTKYAANMNKAVDWLLQKSQARREGLIFSEHSSETGRYMEGHGLSMIFLAGALEAETEKARQQRISDALTQGVKYIVKAQSTRGGWYHTSKMEGHDFDAVLPTVIQIQALQAAEYAGGVPVAKDVLNQAVEYLKKELAKHEKIGPSPGRSFDMAATLACLRINQVKWDIPGRELMDDSCKIWYKYCKAEIPTGQNIKFGRDELTHYYYAQAMHNLFGTDWEQYGTPLFDHVQNNQRKDGSWPAADGIGVGPVYATALWCTVLQVGRNHPAVLISEGND